MKNYSVLLPVSPTYNDKTIFILVYNKLKIVEGYQSDTLLPITSGSRPRRDDPHFLSGGQDSNLRPHAPQTCALPGCATTRKP